MNRLKVLLVDDRKENLLALEAVLRSGEIEFFQATSGVEALELLLAHDFSLAIVDVQMPEMNGFELAELMRGTEQTRSVPIIFVTAGARDRLNTFKGYEKGAVDFLYKPFEPLVVKSKLQVFLELARQRQLLKTQLAETQKILGERDEALEEAREALNVREEFMSIASHELKTPLTSLHLQLQLSNRMIKKSFTVAGEPPPEEPTAFNPEKLASALKICERQSAKLTSLIDELMDVTRIRLGKLELRRKELDLSQLTRDVIERSRADAKQKGSDVQFVADDTVIGVWDYTRIEQVVTNLISNALKYGDGKPVSIKVQSDPTGKLAQIMVTDQGMGIPDDMQEKIFRRFERAVSGKQISGLGLGLYITRQILEAHGGRIKVYSRVAQGSTFTVELPKN